MWRNAVKHVGARFGDKVKKSDYCWTWTAGKDKKGYGRMWVDGKDRRATHVALFLTTGVWPTEQVLHKCDNPECVNPDHLFVGSIADNMADKFAKGRQAKGEQNGNSKLTAEDITRIRSSPASSKQLARELDVHPSSVWLIRARKIWNHV
jgi:hypothetical protein